ncbi:MAG: DUF1573 domain-containing protein [Candidatus Omnitrophica bacterium]|nr:DUF1573 domain-containing protein [Candidatus Omnitrophota bacterium]
MFRVYLMIILGMLIFTGCNTLKAEKTTSVEKAQGSVVSSPYLWDFGRVKQGEVLKHDFVFRNESKILLNIKDAVSSCGCTVSEAGKKVLLPGESTLIKVKFDPAGYLGSVQQFIYVNTDSLENPVIKFIIKAEVSRQ